MYTKTYVQPDQFLDSIRSQMRENANKIREKMDKLDDLANAIIKTGNEITLSVQQNNDKRFVDLYEDLRLYWNEWQAHRSELKELKAADVTSNQINFYYNCILHDEYQQTNHKLEMARDVLTVAKVRYDLLKATGQFPPQDDSVTI